MLKVIPPPHSQPSTENTKAKADSSIPELAPNRYIVVFKDQGGRQITEEKAQQAVQRTHSLLSDFSIQRDSVIHQYKYALKGFAAQLTPLQVELLDKDPRVETVVQDIKYKAIQIMPSNNLKAKSVVMAGQVTPWGVSRVGGPLNGIGKKAWVLDTGIDLNHSDLNVDVSNSVSFVAYESANDQHGHGTHVAGTIAAKNNSIGVVGVAAGADVVAVKVCDSGGYCYTSDLDAGIDYIVSKYSAGDVANISLGWPVSGYNPYIDLPLAILEATIKTAADDGLKFTIAAGNEAQHSDNKSPARIVNNNVWTVSAFRQGDQFVQTFDSNTPNCNPFNNPNSGSNYGNPPVNFSGPGESILSLWKNGGTLTTCGTSMAAPHIAGILLTTGQAPYINQYVSNDPDGNSDPIASNEPYVQKPTISGSVVSNHPKLTWNTSEGAEKYQVWRKANHSGSWTLWSTTFSTSYTDFTTMDSNLSLLPGLPNGSNGWLAYKVIAIHEDGFESLDSQTLYFTYGGIVPHSF